MLESSEINNAYPVTYKITDLKSKETIKLYFLILIKTRYTRPDAINKNKQIYRPLPYII